jgi:hypothetical protein
MIELTPLYPRKASRSSVNPSIALGQLPAGLRQELLTSFNEIVTNFREGRWSPSELDGGKMAEVVYSILRGYIDGSFPVRATKPADMLTACRLLEQESTSFSRSVRIQIPRLLITLYEIRNNRGVGHVGGEVDPNQMDATLVFYSAKWIMAELVRIFHNVDTVVASDIVEALIERELPVVWKVGDMKRILQTKLTMKEKVLLLLYSEASSLTEKQLVDWSEHSNSAIFRRDVLVVGHKARLWEYNKSAKTVTISPLGIKQVEESLLSRIKL